VNEAAIPADPAPPRRGLPIAWLAVVRGAARGRGRVRIVSAAAGQASPGVAPTGTPNAPRLPGHLAAHPRLSQWIALGADGTATVTPGKVEIGQGIVTALASVVAGELALPPARVRMVPASTATSPNEAVTSGSLSMQESGAALRHVAAQLRTRLVEAAAARWGVAPEGLRVDDGRVLDGAGRALGYGEHAASVFALIATEPEVVDVELDGKRWHVATSARRLPQGSPASPAVTNLLCRRLDKRLHGVAAKLGFVYTRYADDLTFSGPKEAPVGKLLRQVRFVGGQEGFTAHEEKTRVLRRGRRQEVTGVVVNEKPSVPRDVLKRFRALLFQIGKDGPEGKRWGSSPDVFAAAMGFAAWVRMVDRTKGDALLGEVRALAKKHGWTPPKHDPPKGGGDGGGAPEAAKAEEPKKKKWWQLF